MPFHLVFTMPSGNRYVATDKESCLALVPVTEGEMVRGVWSFPTEKEAWDHLEKLKSSANAKGKEFLENEGWDVQRSVDLEDYVAH